MKRATMAIALAAALMLVLGSMGQSSAAPFSYSEPPDLPNNLPAASVFPFDVGTNTVSGGHVIFELDSFAFSIPSGSQLTQIRFSFQTQLFGVFSAATDQYRLDNGNAVPVSPFLGDQTIDLLGSSPVSVFAGALPLGPGTYGLTDVIRHVTAQGLDQFVNDTYTWSFTVVQSSSVSEPASLLLLGIGALGLISRRALKQCN